MEKTPKPIIETQRLMLRCLTDDDLPAFALMNSDPEVMTYFPSTVDEQTTMSMIRSEQDNYRQEGYCLFACVLKETAEFIGFVGLHKVGFEIHFAPAVEVGWRLVKAHWNQGYATEAALVVIDFGFSEIGLQEIVSFTARQNKASIRVMEKCGLTRSFDDDFLHPNLKRTDHLAPHVLYRVVVPG
ncbi:GNAT family N-acetyltransferase [bacterium]|nr:GNAT family N-acetyltransferase [bacterium]